MNRAQRQVVYERLHAQIENLMDQGMSQVEIANVSGFSVSTIQYHLRKIEGKPAWRSRHNSKHGELSSTVIRIPSIDPLLARLREHHAVKEVL